MGYATYQDVAERWLNRVLGYTTKPNLTNKRMPVSGDAIYSYGTHFEIARLIRDPRGNPESWLLNGDRWGNTTSKHQSIVRSVIQARSHLPSVILPYSAPIAADIDLSTVRTLDTQADWFTSTTHRSIEMPGKWEYEYGTIYDDHGGWRNSLTGEIVLRSGFYSHGEKPWVECAHPEGQPVPRDWSVKYGTPEHDEYLAACQRQEAHIRLHHGVWDEIPPSSREHGRKRVVSGVHGRTAWDIVADDDAPLGYSYERTTERHWLGASLISAKVNYTTRVTCRSCSGTGKTTPYIVRQYDVETVGPLTESDMIAVQSSHEFMMNRWQRDRAEFPDRPEPVMGWPRMIDASVHVDGCRACSGQGKVPSMRQRTALFLSGFDNNEARPSYFFCELDPKARPTTVEEALESLKPEAVKVAEQAGREVKRQGDIFAIPMPSLTLSKLRTDGGVYARLPKGYTQANAMDGETADVPYLLDTNHGASEVVTVGGATYARGTMRHLPAWRRPDHARLTLGKQWHLIVKNTVPVGAGR